MLLCWLIVAPLHAPISAQGDPARVRFDPSDLQVGQGQVEEVNVIVENANDIYGIDLRAEFDPKQIEIVDTDPAKDGVQMRPGTFIKPDFLVRNEADNSAGTLQYVITQVNPTPPATGSGIVLTILVRGKKQGASSPFTINSVQVANGKGTKLPIEPQPGTVQVVPPKPETATPEITKTAAPTEPPTVQVTRAAAAATRSRPTTVPANAPRNNNDLITNLLLGGVALGGCLLALLILGVGVFLVMRKPRTVPPQYPRGR